MKTAVMGTGMVGRTLSAKLAELGHEVTLGTRDIERTLSNQESDFYGNPPFKDWHAENKNIVLRSFSNAAESADILFVCTHGSVAISALEMAGPEQVNGKLLIDVTNGLVFGGEEEPPSLDVVNTDSVAEQIQRKFPEAKVVKTLNTVDHELMVNPASVEGNHNVFVSGNDDKAKDLTKEILQDFGWKENQIIDLGGIIQARAMEMHVILWWRLYAVLGTPKFNIEIRRNA